MTKKPAEPDEMRMPADKFDDMMRRALGTPPPAPSKRKPKPRPRARKVETPPKAARKGSAQ